jgi:hypothetical protein
MVSNRTRTFKLTPGTQHFPEAKPWEAVFRLDFHKNLVIGLLKIVIK